jgi:cell wall-associated NlpC family hydrolase
VEVLPSENLGKLKFALVKVPHAYSYAKPTEKGEPMTQGLLGDPVYLLKKMMDDFFLCQTAEGYVGYIKGDQIQRVDSKKFARYQDGPQAYVLKDQKKEEKLLIPFGARLKKAGDKGDDVIVELPDGSKASIPKNQVEVRENRTHERIENAIKIAEQMIGSRYAWGGKTSEGVDCSGLIQSSFRSQGINMPRDAYQQAYVGFLVATRWYRKGLRRGDTLFFLGRTGRISHVAIYLGDDQYLEASRGDVHYTSFNPKHENFNERKLEIFCFAKRVLE